MRGKQYSITWWLIFMLTTAVAQEEDSIRIQLLQHTPYEVAQFSDWSNTLDRIPVPQTHREYMNLGNIGMPEIPLVYRPQLVQGFQSGFKPLQSAIAPTHYNVTQPLTMATYLNGSKEEQRFSILHTQNIKPHWNFGLLYDNVKSVGFYDEMTTKLNEVNLNTHYRSRNHRYELYSYFNHDETIRLENGGISDNAAFENNEVANRRVIDIHLASARNDLRIKTMHAQHYYYLGPVSGNDTLGKQVMPRFRIGLMSEAEEERYRYSDAFPADGFYSNIYLDSALTNDLAAIRTIRNELVFQGVQPSDTARIVINPSLGYRHEYVWSEQHTIDTTFENHMVKGGINMHIPGGIHWKVEGHYGLSGYNEGDTYFGGEVSYSSNFFFNRIKLHGAYQQREADWIMKAYESNHFQWSDTAYIKTTTTTGGVALLSSDYDLQLAANYTNVANPTYFFYDATSRQSGREAQVLQVGLSKEVEWKNIHFNNSIYYHELGGTPVIRVPQFLLNSSIYIEGHMFKKVMFTRFGVDLKYYTSYYSKAYMPATRQFYLQDTEKVGGYPFADVYVSARVKKFKFFVIYSHINAGWLGYDYYVVPNYPMHDGTLRFGINWRFFN